MSNTETTTDHSHPDPTPRDLLTRLATAASTATSETKALLDEAAEAIGRLTEREADLVHDLEIFGASLECLVLHEAGSPVPGSEAIVERMHEAVRRSEANWQQLVAERDAAVAEVAALREEREAILAFVIHDDGDDEVSSVRFTAHAHNTSFWGPSRDRVLSAILAEGRLRLRNARSRASAGQQNHEEQPSQ